jgi:hypothetical protein
VLAAFGCVMAAVALSRLLRQFFARKVHPLGGVAKTNGMDNKKGEPMEARPKSEI